MTKLHKIATPVPADPRFIQMRQEVFKLACMKRALVEAAGRRIDLYFECLGAATASVDMVEALTESFLPGERQSSIALPVRAKGGRQ